MELTLLIVYSAFLYLLPPADFRAHCFKIKGAARKEKYLRVGISTAELLQSRGYAAEEHAIVSDDGYVIGLTAATNPRIDGAKKRALNLDPVLFVHGTGVNANVWLVNSRLAKAGDFWRRHDLRRATEGDLVRQLGEEPASNCLAMLLLNFGYDLWFLHRRGSLQWRRRLHQRPAKPPPSPYEKLLRAYQLAHKSGHLMEWESNGQQMELIQRRERKSGHTIGLEAELRTQVVGLPPESTNATAIEEDRRKSLGLNSRLLEAVEAALPRADAAGNLLEEIRASLDRRLWNHSLDEQAAYDLPRAVEYVLSESNRTKCIYVGSSSAGALGLMALILNPELNEQLSKAIIIAPSFNMGHAATNALGLMSTVPTINYVGPYPLSFLSGPLQKLKEIFCSLELLQETLCQLIQSFGAGPTGGQMPVRGEYYTSYFVPVSAFEYFQFAQWLIYKAPRFFHYGKEKNARLYGGNTEPPLYDARLIRNEHLTIWASKDDTLIVEKDHRITLRDLRVKHKFVFIDNKNVTFDHSAFVWHRSVGRVMNIPILIDLAGASNLREADRLGSLRSPLDQEA